jgi:hypothetical protein
MKEKNSVFSSALDSLLSNEMIDVSATSDGIFPTELVISGKSEKNKETEDAAKKAADDEEKDLIELDPNDITEEESEEEEEGESGTEETLEESSSKNEQSPQSKKAKTSSPLTPYAQLLVDEGVLPNLDVKKFDGTADGLKEAMVTEIMGAVNSYKDSLPDRIKNLINNYEEGIPLEKLLELDHIETDVSKVTDEKLEDDVPLQKKLVSDYLKRTTKFSETKISKLVDGYEDAGELEEEAKSSLTELKSFVDTEKAKELKTVEKQKVDNERQRKEDLLALQEKVKSTNEIIPGLKLNDKIKSNVLASMTTPVGYDQTGRPVNKIVAARMDNPVEFEIKLHYLFEVTKGFTDFSKLAEKGKKDATKSFEAAVSELDNTKFEESGETKQLGRKSTDFLKSLEKVYKI